jgi:hypothetical protein
MKVSILDRCVRSYCHRIIKLSDAVPAYPYSVTSNIHGKKI